MKIGIISDSHDNLANIAKAAEAFHQRAVGLVVHAGDICSPPAIRVLEGLPVAGVLGNNDGEVLGLKKAFDDLGGRLEGQLLELEVMDGVPMAVYHGTSKGITRALIASGHYRVVITGHTHAVVDRMEGETRVLNPGTASGLGKPATVMVYDVASGEAEVITLDG